VKSEAVHLPTVFSYGKLSPPSTHFNSSISVAYVPINLFSNILYLPFNLSDPVSHPYKYHEQSQLCIITFMFLEMSGEYKQF
jgi:hypothetical protein